MKSYTIRLDPAEVEKLEQEAEEQGFNNRTEYMRYIIRNRPTVDKSTAESLANRLSELEEKVEQLESGLDE